MFQIWMDFNTPLDELAEQLAQLNIAVGSRSKVEQRNEIVCASMKKVFLFS